MMRTIFRSLLPAALAFAITPAHAARVPESPKLADERGNKEETTAAQYLPVTEFWKIMQSELGGELAELQEAVNAEFRAALVPTGKAEAGWKNTGMDLMAHIASLPGGTANNAILTLGDAPSLEFLGKIPADLLADWDYVQSGPKAVSPLEANSGAFFVISPNHLLFLAADEIRTGNASCMKDPMQKASDHVTVYRYSGTPFDPESDASVEAETEAIVMHHMMGGLGSPPICSIYRRNEEGRLQIFAYTPDGRPLGLMDDDGDRLEIVSGFNLYEQLNANYTSAFADDVEQSNPAEAARDPS